MQLFLFTLDDKLECQHKLWCSICLSTLVVWILQLIFEVDELVKHFDILDISSPGSHQVELTNI